MYKNLAGKIGNSVNYRGFNPCFNGSMYKNIVNVSFSLGNLKVSILVLMDLCIKTNINMGNSPVCI